MAEEEEARGGSIVEQEEEEENMESRIKRAMHSRVSYFKEQADSLTFEGVRRLLENDLELETYALDVHKRFIKQCLSECMDGTDDDYDSTNPVETVEQNVSLTKGEVAESPVKHQTQKNLREPSSEDEEKMEDSPVMGLLTGQKTTKSEADELHGIGKKVVPSESTIKKVISKRAAYFKANSETITVAGVRRLLEEDLELDKYTLDPFKKFISEQLNKVLSAEASISAKDVKKNSSNKNSQRKLSKHISPEGSSDSLDGESEDVEDEIKSKKKVSPKGKIQKSEGLKKRKRSPKETKVSSKKQNKLAEKTSEENSDAEDGGNVSEDSQSQSSVKKSKKEISAPVHGKQVEHLKSIIKSCGMSVPPSVYKKVKQAPENKREASLIKELEEILSKEGLSTNPTEKEMKEVRKSKERAKELEGIDMSNIVSSSRRRSTISFVPPPKPKIPVESDDDTEDTDSDDEGEDNEDDNEDVAGDGDESQSEEFNEDEDDSE